MLVAALGLGAATACGGSDDAESGDATADATSMSSESPPVAEAGEVYLRIVDDKNAVAADAFERFDRAEADGDPAEAASAMRDYGRANRRFADEVSRTRWPADVEPEMAALSEAAEAEAEAAEDYADSILAFGDGSASASDTAAAAERLFDATRATLDAAGPVREALRLPPVPGA